MYIGASPKASTNHNTQTNQTNYNRLQFSKVMLIWIRIWTLVYYYARNDLHASLWPTGIFQIAAEPIVLLSLATESCSFILAIWQSWESGTYSWKIINSTEVKECSTFWKWWLGLSCDWLPAGRSSVSEVDMVLSDHVCEVVFESMGETWINSFKWNYVQLFAVNNLVGDAHRNPLWSGNIFQSVQLWQVSCEQKSSKPAVMVPLCDQRGCLGAIMIWY